MEAAWLFGCSAEMKHVGFNTNHAGLIKVLAVGEVRLSFFCSGSHL